jgi:hypothetical protein
VQWDVQNLINASAAAYSVPVMQAKQLQSVLCNAGFSIARNHASIVTHGYVARLSALKHRPRTGSDSTTT